MLTPFLQIEKNEVGCDEAGRGALAGPVVAAAVILDLSQKSLLSQLDDSKKLSKRARFELAIEIKSNALAYGVGVCSVTEIDSLNILWASVKAMHKALSKLTISPKFILVDGNQFNPYKNIPHQCIVKGDSKYMSIAAASILAKTTRDDMMLNYHRDYPNYGWNTNMGYPTVKHYEGIEKHGTCPHHRKSFKLKRITAPSLFE